MLVAIDALQDPLARMIRLRGQHFPPEVRDDLVEASDQLDRAVTRANSLSGLLDAALTASLTQISVQQNDDMRKISAWVAMAAVPTMVAGIYGMNFDHMPELEWTFGYPLVIGSHGDRRGPPAPTVQEERLALRSSVTRDGRHHRSQGEVRVPRRTRRRAARRRPGRRVLPRGVLADDAISRAVPHPHVPVDRRRHHRSRARRRRPQVHRPGGAALPEPSSGERDDQGPVGPRRRRRTAGGRGSARRRLPDGSTPRSHAASTSCTPRGSRR